MRFSRIAILPLLFTLGPRWGLAAEPLKVCAAENELPYSDKDGRGFENKLAELIAKDLGRPVENVWWQDPRYFIRDQLEPGLCDVVIGVDAGDPRMLTSKAYYRSGYVFVYPKGKGIKVGDWDSDYIAKARQIAFMPDTPAETMLRKIGRYNDQFNYLQSLVGYKARRNQYVRWDPEKLVQEVASGHADLAVIWGPQAGRYVLAAGDRLAISVVPDHQVRADGQPVPFHFSTSVGVRKENGKALLDQIEGVLKKRSKEIQQLLKAEGIPLLPLNETKPSGGAAHRAKKS